MSKRSSPTRQIDTRTNLPTSNVEDDNEEIFTTPFSQTKSVSSKTYIKPSPSSNRLNSRLWTWLRSSMKTTLIGNKDESITKTDRSSLINTPQTSDSQSDEIKTEASSEKISPIIVAKHLEKLKKSRLHIGPGTILLTFIISKFDYLTYLTLILNFLASGAAVIWLPLLASIYFWAILTFPYPSRRFWHVITFSTMIILLAQ
jgi:hypothetical protein